MRISVIDLGFNSVKMVNYDVKKNDGSFKAYQQEAAKVRLGEGLHRTGYLGREPARRTIEALKLFRDIINFDSVKHVLAVATSAVRDAGNREDFLKQVQAQTGFQFRVLSGQEEAFYSYVGALQATCVPTALFFDIGGGSLELVYTENYAIKKAKSYQLGALRLSQMFGEGDGTFSKKAYDKLEEHIRDALPDKKELGLSVDTTLVGVGGVLRALARRDQELTGYGLDKVHNYRLKYDSVASMAKDLHRMDAGELAEVKAVGANRAETVVAGSAVISVLMDRLGFDSVTVSARGLREGIMSVFARDPKTYYSGGINNEKAKAYVAFSCQRETLPQHTFTLVKPLVAAGLLREKEKAILTHAIKEMADLPAITNYSNLFHLMMDEDNAFLTHREQLILALAIVYSRKDKVADLLFSRYRSTILEPQNMKSVKKIAACLALSAIIEKSKAAVRVSVSGGNSNNNNNSKQVSIKLTPGGRQFLPSVLLAGALKNFEEAFNVSVSCQIVAAAGSGGRQEVRVIT